MSEQGARAAAVVSDAGPARRSLRVAIVQKTLGFGGAERVAIEQLRALARVPSEVDVLLTDVGARRLEDPLREAHPAVREIRETGDGLRFARALARGKYDVLVTSGTRGAWRTIQRMAWWPGFRRPAVIATVHSPHPKHVGTLGEFALRVVDVVAVTYDFRASLARDLAFPIERTVVTWTVFPSSVLTCDARAEADARARRAAWGVREGAVVLGYFGRIAHNKGVHHLLAMASRLAAEGLDVHVALGGEVNGRGSVPGTRYEDEIERWLAAPALAGRVHLIEDTAPSAALYRSFDLMVQPTMRDGTTLTLFESISAGTPVIATRVGGIATILEDGVDAALVAKDPDDGSELSPQTLAAFEARLRALVIDADERRRLRSAGPARARELVARSDFGDAFREAVALALTVRARGGKCLTIDPAP